MSVDSNRRDSWQHDARRLSAALLCVVQCAGAAHAGTEWQSLGEASLAGGETKELVLDVQAPGIYRLDVEQRGIDVMVELRDPAGVSLGQTDAPGVRCGVERFAFRADTAGEWLARIEPRSRHALRGTAGIALARLGALDAADAPVAALSFELTNVGLLARPDIPEKNASALDVAVGAVALAKGVDDPLRAAAEFQLASLYSRLQQPAASIEHMTRAAALYEKLGDAAMQAGAFNMLGLEHANTRNLAEARSYTERAIALQSTLPWRFDELESRGNLCWIAQEAHALDEAQQCLDALLPEVRASGEIELLAILQNNAAGVTLGLGDVDGALSLLEQTIELRERLGDPGVLGILHHNLAMVYRRSGEIAPALEHYLEAIPYRQAADDRRGLAVTYNNLGYLFEVIGDLPRARVYYMAARKLALTVEDGVTATRADSNLGTLSRQQGAYDDAVSHHVQALASWRALDNAQGVCRALTLLAADHRARGAIKDARDVIAQALPDCAGAADTLTRAGLLVEYGRILAVDDAARGRAELERGLALFEQMHDPVGIASANDALAEVSAREGDLPRALVQAERATKALDSLRMSIAAWDQLLRFSGVQQSVYDRAIALHLAMHAARPEAGHDLKALDLVLATRARTLVEQLAPAPEPGTLPDTGTAAAERRAHRLRTAELANRYYAAIEKSEPGATDLGVQYELARARLDELESKMRAAESRGTLPLPTAKHLQATLNGEALMLVYSLRDDASTLWAMRRDAITTHTLPARGKIETLARSVYEGLRAAEPSPGDALARDQLSEWLLGTVTELPQHPELYVSADGVLNYIPFAALTSPAGAATHPVLLVDTHRIASLPAPAASLAPPTSPGKPVPGASIVVFADPVYGPTDPRLASVRVVAPAADTPEWMLWHELTDLPRLPGSRREAELLADLAADTRLHLDFAASRDELLELERTGVELLHVGTHARVRNDSNTISGLVLSLFDERGQAQGGLVSYYDVMQLRYAPRRVVLSGCDTALGVNVRGEGAVGLARAFLSAGAETVVSSVWLAGDSASVRLMDAFYDGLLAKGLAPAAALQRAQLALREDRRFRRTYAWAGFTVSERAPLRAIRATPVAAAGRVATP